MIGKIFIPVIQLSDIEYDENFAHEVIKRYDFKSGVRGTDMYDEGINEYTQSLYSHRNVIDNYRVKDIPHTIKECECECFISDSEDNEVTCEYIEKVVESGKMFIMKININPDGIDTDCETELKFWMDDSNKLLKDNSLDKETKMKYLPMRSFRLILGENTYLLHNCKMFRHYNKTKNAPFYFAVLIKKITFKK